MDAKETPHHTFRVIISSRLPTLLDFFVWVIATYFSLFLRFEGQRFDLGIDSVFVYGVLFGIVGTAAGFANGLYRRRFVFGSREEVFRIAIVAIVCMVVVSIPTWFLLSLWQVPRSIPVVASLVFLLGALSWRAGVRHARHRPKSSQSRQAALIFGAGFAGQRLVNQLLDDQDSPLTPVGFIDDDAALRNLQVRGVPVLGNWSDFPQVAKTLSPGVLLVAIPGASPELLTEVFGRAQDLGLEVRVLPSLHHYLRGTVGSGLRDISLEDLVGRSAVRANELEIQKMIAGRRILVTGAGGHIGAELVLQIASYAPSTLILADRDETLMMSSKMAVALNHPTVKIEEFLMDIRDKATVKEMFETLKPDIVFHAAALKHVSILERFPEEAWKTNVLGTINILTEAAQNRVEKFVNVSTDKAANPANVLGRTKGLGEQLTEWFARETGLSFCSVRFGNVLGSRGSLVPILAEQIRRGGPVTLTDRQATRFFMSTTEACALVLQAATEPDVTGVLVLDMGRPVRITEVAQKMMQLAGKSVPIEFVGLRPGEKLHEELWEENAVTTESSHPLITKVLVEPRSPTEILEEEKAG